MFDTSFRLVLFCVLLRSVHEEDRKFTWALPPRSAFNFSLPERKHLYFGFLSQCMYHSTERQLGTVCVQVECDDDDSVQRKGRETTRARRPRSPLRLEFSCCGEFAPVPVRQEALTLGFPCPGATSRNPGGDHLPSWRSSLVSRMTLRR